MAVRTIYTRDNCSLALLEAVVHWCLWKQLFIHWCFWKQLLIRAFGSSCSLVFLEAVVHWCFWKQLFIGDFGSSCSLVLLEIFWNSDEFKWLLLNYFGNCSNGKSKKINILFACLCFLYFFFQNNYSKKWKYLWPITEKSLVVKN